MVGATPAAWQREMYDLVRAAQRAGRDALAPGAALADVDAAARSVIDAAGYGPQFAHGLGHGVGLEIHEAPMIGPPRAGTLDAGIARSPSSPGSTCPGAAASASRTPSWCGRPGRAAHHHRPRSCSSSADRGRAAPPRLQETHPVASTNDLKNGLVLNIDGQLWTVVEFQHVKPGQGPGLRPHQAEERPVRQGRRQDLQRRRARSRRPTSTSATMQYLYKTAPTSSSWTPRPTTRSTCPRETVGDGAQLPAGEPGGHRRDARGRPAVRRAARLGRARRSPTPSRACRATARPAAPSRPRSRPASRSRCRCSSPHGEQVKVDTRDGSYLGRVNG